MTGARAAIRYLTAEFGTPDVNPSATAAELVIRFGPTSGRRGRYKGTWWRVLAAPPGRGRPLEAAVEVHGPFGYPLIQSLIVEQLIGAAAPGGGAAMVPAAGLLSREGGAVALIGGSGVGKTAISLAALASGWSVLSDDHLLIDAAGAVRGMPRRMRLHGTTLDVVPGTRAALRPSERSRQWLLAVMERLTLGRIRLPNLVPASRFGAFRPDEAVLLGSVVAIERQPGAEPRTTVLERDSVLDLAAEAIAAERIGLRAALGPEWDAHLAEVERAEREILTTAIGRVRLVSTTVPTSWSPAHILDHIAGHLAEISRT